MRRLKLLWDFRGPVAKQTAIHHEIHLKEYAAAQSLTKPITGTQELSEMHTVAFLVVNESEMPGVRDALKPHRGQLYEQN
ncbi:MAG: hypothetical protein ABNH00_07800 [Dokdonia sp.]|jgi:hypothetical protein|nr:hypothetical protein [Cytophagaceae bacterium]